MTLESVIEGIAKRCKANNDSLNEWFEHRDERSKHLDSSKQSLQEAIDARDEEQIKYYLERVKFWEDELEFAQTTINYYDVRQIELVTLCDSIGLNYFDLALGGAQ